jgi:hypothetical protein
VVGCVALVAALGLQLVLPYRVPAPEANSLAVRRAKPFVIPLLPEFPAILRAPIFAPDRRPGLADQGASAAAGSLGTYAALGAASGHGVGAAVVSGPGGAVKTLRLGDEIEGWRLVAVTATKLTFERKGARHELLIGAPAEAVNQASNPAPDQ